MVVRPLVRSLGNPLESVQIQLPLKARELPMLEVRHHGRPGKVLGMSNHKTSAVLLPPQHGGIVHPGCGEEGVEPLGEGLGDTSRVGRFLVVPEDDAGGDRGVVRVGVVDGVGRLVGSGRAGGASSQHLRLRLRLGLCLCLRLGLGWELGSGGRGRGGKALLSLGLLSLGLLSLLGLLGLLGPVRGHGGLRLRLRLCLGLG